MVKICHGRVQLKVRDGAAPRPVIMSGTMYEGWFAVRVFFTASLSRALPVIMVSWLVRIVVLRPWASSCESSLLGVRTRAVTWRPARRARTRAEFTTPPVAPKNAIVGACVDILF